MNNDKRGMVYMDINGKDTELFEIKDIIFDKAVDPELKKRIDSCKGEQPGWDNLSSKDLHGYVTSIQKIVNEAKEASLSYSMAIEEVKNKNPDFYQFFKDEFDRLERERQSFVRKDKSAADSINVYLFRGFNDRKRIGGEYDCKLDALSAIKEHALNELKRGEVGVYGLFHGKEITHVIKSDGKAFEITEMNFGRRQTSNDMALNKNRSQTER